MVQAGLENSCYTQATWWGPLVNPVFYVKEPIGKAVSRPSPHHFVALAACSAGWQARYQVAEQQQKTFTGSQFKAFPFLFSHLQAGEGSNTLIFFFWPRSQQSMVRPPIDIALVFYIDLHIPTPIDLAF